jgi:prepilin-type N-terminal cleavage/methylation domain-containing protein/prepilin-type processing-associated H-X9-DG protein
MRHRGLSLVELLVVMVIVAILMALSTSAFRRVRQQARSAVCQNNQRQLLVGLSAYEAAWTALPSAFEPAMTVPPGGYAGDLARDAPGVWWFHALGMPTPRPEIQKPTTLACPSRRITDSDLLYNCLYGNYGVNWSICRGWAPWPYSTEFRGQPLATSALVRTSETLLIADSGYALISWWHVTADPPFPLGNRSGLQMSYLPGLDVNRSRSLLPGQREDAVEGRHGNKTVNIGLADGHVEHRPAEALRVTKAEGGYAGVSPLWKPASPSDP